MKIIVCILHLEAIGDFNKMINGLLWIKARLQGFGDKIYQLEIKVTYMQQKSQRTLTSPRQGQIQKKARTSTDKYQSGGSRMSEHQGLYDSLGLSLIVTRWLLQWWPSCLHSMQKEGRRERGKKSCAPEPASLQGDLPEASISIF